MGAGKARAAKLNAKMYGTKRPHEAAQAMWNLSEAYDDDPDAQSKHLKSYLQPYRLAPPRAGGLRRRDRAAE